MQTPEDIKKTGLKITVPRLKILDLFRKAQAKSLDRHLSAEDVYRQLMNEGENIGLATIYRVLLQFAQAGLLDRHVFDSGKAVYELKQGEHHDHLVCLQCGRVEEFSDSTIEKRQALIAKDRQFTLKAHSLCLYVDCLRKHCPYKR